MKGLTGIGKIIGLFILVIMMGATLFSGVFWVEGFTYNECIIKQGQEITELRRDIELVKTKGSDKINVFYLSSCADYIWFDREESTLKVRYSLKKGLISPVETNVVSYPMSAQFIDFGCDCNENSDEEKLKACANINQERTEKGYTLNIENINNNVLVKLTCINSKDPNCEDEDDTSCCKKSEIPCESCYEHESLSDCQKENCYWCEADSNNCDDKRYTSNGNFCVQNEESCEYECVKGKCDATCSSSADCPIGEVCHPTECKCVDCSTQNRNTCINRGCYWCNNDNNCLGKKYIENPCVASEEFCYYECVKDECGAECSFDMQCPSFLCDTEESCECIYD